MPRQEAAVVVAVGSGGQQQRVEGYNVVERLMADIGGRRECKKFHGFCRGHCWQHHPSCQQKLHGCIEHHGVLLEDGHCCLATRGRLSMLYCMNTASGESRRQTAQQEMVVQEGGAALECNTNKLTASNDNNGTSKETGGERVTMTVADK